MTTIHTDMQIRCRLSICDANKNKRPRTKASGYNICLGSSVAQTCHPVSRNKVILNAVDSNISKPCDVYGMFFIRLTETDFEMYAYKNKH